MGIEAKLDKLKDKLKDLIDLGSLRNSLLSLENLVYDKSRYIMFSYGIIANVRAIILVHFLKDTRVKFVNKFKSKPSSSFS